MNKGDNDKGKRLAAECGSSTLDHEDGVCCEGCACGTWIGEAEDDV